MLNLRQLAMAALLSILLYLMVFGFIVHKPITVGIVRDYLALKTRYLATHAQDRKIVILAGSNGRFSHRCETIEALAHAPCVNMSFAAGWSLPWQLDRIKPYLRRGDVLYLPLEYRTTGAPAPAENEAPYIMAYAKHDLLAMRPRQLLHTLFSFDLRFLLSGIGEMALQRGGVKSRFSADTMTPQGDERGHDDAKAAAYASFLAGVAAPAFIPSNFASSADWPDLVPMLAWARDAGVVVVGGLPTMVDESHLPAGAIRFLQHLYTGQGQCFLALPNESRYPRSFFYDALFHLTERHQIEHSALLAPYLAETLRTGVCPAAAIAP